MLRIECDLVTDGDDRVQHRALAARQWCSVTHRPGGNDRASAANELHAIGLIGDFANIPAVHGHQVEQPRCLLVERARTARAEDRLPLVDDLGLHKQIAERRMQRVRSRCGENHFRVTRHVNRATYPRAITDVHAAQFDVVFR